MKTERLSVTQEAYSQSIERAAGLLQNGGIVAIPTETVYGLAASCYDPAAVAAVFQAKGRPQDNPLIVHIADIEQLSEIAYDIPQAAFACAEAFWPGPLTVILKRTEKIPFCVSAGLNTVAVRMPSHPIARDIIRASGLPLAAPSANASGRPSPTAAAHVLTDLDGKIDAVVMAGDCAVGVESTVISLCGDVPRLLRPGAVTAEQLQALLPRLVIDKAVLAEPEKGTKVASPGMKYRHYAPETETVLVEADADDFVRFVNQKENSAAVCFFEEGERIHIPKLCYGSGTDEATLARQVFTALREVDALGMATVYVHAPSKTGIGLAVYNRLLRAAAFRVIRL